jgi:hypothetical protein
MGEFSFFSCMYFLNWYEYLCVVINHAIRFDPSVLS